MKSINLFKFKDTSEFWVFLNSYGYKFEDVKGFSLAERKQLQGNIWTEYCIYFNDDEKQYFRAVCFKDFHEYKQTLLGFSCYKLINWFEDSDINWYK